MFVCVIMLCNYRIVTSEALFPWKIHKMDALQRQDVTE